MDFPLLPEFLTGNRHLKIDQIEHSIIREGQTIALTRLEFDLLVALAKEPGRVFSREALLSEVWGYRPATDTRLVNVHIQRLRSKIEINPEDPKVIVTVRGVGYKAGVPGNSQLNLHLKPGALP